MRRIFWGFCINRFLMSPLHYLSSCSDFGFEFAEIPPLPDSPIWGVVFRLRISPRIRRQNRNDSKCSVRDLCRTGLCKNLRKSASLPCPFNRHNFWGTSLVPLSLVFANGRLLATKVILAYAVFKFMGIKIVVLPQCLLFIIFSSA